MTLILNLIMSVLEFYYYSIQFQEQGTIIIINISTHNNYNLYTMCIFVIFDKFITSGFVFLFLAKHIISTLSFEDKVALFGLAETVLYPDAIGCSELYMSYATEKNKVLFINFIDSLTKFKGR